MHAVLQEKHDALIAALASQPVLVAFSGGVDSSLLLALARAAQPSKLLAVTGISASVSQLQLQQARRVARFLEVEHLELATEELSDPRYQANPDNRCYFCKHELYGRLSERFKKDWPLIVDGTNADDLGGHRPGRQAAIEEGIRSPLAEQGLTKDEIRELSRYYGLETAELPSSPCLASRVLTGVAIDASVLGRIERAEAAIHALGFREYRVRDLGNNARFELAAVEHGKMEGQETAIKTAILAAGFESVVIDPRPLKSGRLSSESA